MATIRKRGESYQIDYFDPTGKRIRKSFRKKKTAKAELAKRVSLIAEGRYLDVKKDFKTTFNKLLKKYEKNYQHQASSDRTKRFWLGNFKEYFGESTLLSNLRYVDLESYQNQLRLKLTKFGGRFDAAVNREMKCLRHIFNKIEDFRFHDLRHTFASHMIMSGANLKELQEILGHKDIKMTMTYAHLSQEHKKKAVNLLNGLIASEKPSKKATCHKTATSLEFAKSHTS